jgi:hypothetical protein
MPSSPTTSPPDPPAFEWDASAPDPTAAYAPNESRPIPLEPYMEFIEPFILSAAAPPPRVFYDAVFTLPIDAPPAPGHGDVSKPEKPETE